MRYLGIDFGTAKVGLALSDEAGTMGFPHSVLQNTPKLLDEVVALTKREQVGTIVIGDSKDSSGKENAVAPQARIFAGKLSEATGLPVHFELEAFSTQEARRGFEGERGHTTATTDASAAALILTTYLSHHGT